MHSSSSCSSSNGSGSIGCPDKGTSVISLATAATTTTAAMFTNADDNLSNCVQNSSQYN